MKELKELIVWFKAGGIAKDNLRALAMLNRAEYRLASLREDKNG